MGDEEWKGLRKLSFQTNFLCKKQKASNKRVVRRFIPYKKLPGSEVEKGKH